MDHNFEKLFSHLKPPEPPADLLDKILNRIQREKKLINIKRRIVVFSLGVLGPAIAFIPAFRAVQAEIAESGFSELFSLIFSDLSVVINLWDQFILSILESLPVMSMVLLFTIIFVFLGSLKYLVRDITTILATSQLTNNQYGYQ